MRWIKGIGLILALGLAPVAMSAPVTFNFNENRQFSSEGHDFVGSDGVHVVSATPWSDRGTPKLGSTFWAGLGIVTCTDYDRNCYGRDDDTTSQIDGRGNQEAVYFSFGESVNLLSATFTYIGGNDDFTLLADGVTVYDDEDPTGSGFLKTFSFGDGVFAEEFAFLADHRSDDFKLYSITADYVSNVPEPASLSLLGLGLLALGSFRKKA